MLVPNRHGSSNSYRYGFQGQEKDDELKGEGNSLNYTFRMHDPRVGRFFARDPLEKKYPYLTPYQFSSNQPLHASELEGLVSSNELGGNYAQDDTELMFSMMFGWFGDARAGVLNLTSRALGSDDRFVGDGFFGFYKLPKDAPKPSLSSDLFDTTVGLLSARYGIKSGSVFSVKTTGSSALKLIKDLDLNGSWREIKRSLSGLEYQSYLSGKPIVNGNKIKEFNYNGVNFDGYSNGILFDAKDGYSSWFKSGKMKDWAINSGAAEKFVKEANSQIKAADGNKLQWIFSDKNVVEPMKNFLKGMGVDVSKIEFKHVPKPSK